MIFDSSTAFIISALSVSIFGVGDGFGVGDTAGVGVGETVGVSVGSGLSVGFDVVGAVNEGVTVGVAVGFGESVGVSVSVGAAVGSVSFVVSVVSGAAYASLLKRLNDVPLKFVKNNPKTSNKVTTLVHVLKFFVNIFSLSPRK